MKKVLFVITLFIVATVNVNAQDWIDYKSEDLAFIAKFPAEPTRTVQDVESEIGMLKMYMLNYTPPADEGDENQLYGVIRTDYPKSHFEDADEAYNNNVLDGAIEGAVSNIKGKLVFDNKIKLNGFPGRSVKIDIEIGSIYMKTFLIENKMFITQVICLTDKDNNDSINRFLNSFDILKVKE
ncbi:hypothetical protein FG167_13430 [Lacinutrix sp. WUR7]|uniref:hypothetical protein n=1 Tax=Lacinutrix sp. WUR7 TaxID=2653681 RepID=UPI00193DA591|nr:hypothetical protein [Lacinutrix sp. WUR7]QRM90193.1 hypothetical protein FG167_13430 [Lacinutrix sp. WUR7]